MATADTRLAVWLGLVCALIGQAVSAQAAGGQVPQIETEARTLVILGASYANGLGQPPLPGFARVVNRGVGGDNTAAMLARFSTDVASLKPAAVLIWGHVNNITQARAEGIEGAKQAAREHYVEMLRRARDAGIEPIFATEIPWTEPTGFLNTLYGWYAALAGKTSYAARVSGHVREVNEFLKSLCQRERCRVLDFEAVFANKTGTRRSEYASDDGSHISRAGYAALTAYAARELRRTP